MEPVQVPEQLVQETRLSQWQQRPVPKAGVMKLLVAADAGVGSFCIRQGAASKVLGVLLPGPKLGSFRINEAADGSVEMRDLASVAGMTFPNLADVVKQLQA